jgi:IS5 family transposase
MIVTIGRPSIDLRLLCGLLILKNMYDLSDQSVIQVWSENHYYQAFTGSQHLRISYPCDSSTLTNFRKRIGIKGAEIIFKYSVLIHRENALETETILIRQFKRNI